MSSYHENGSVATLNVKACKIAVESNAFVGKLGIASSATASTVAVQNNGTIFESDEITYSEEDYTTTGNENDLVNNVTTVDTSDTLEISTADALINLASCQSSGSSFSFVSCMFR